MIVDVTPADIAEGVAYDCSKCPIARSVRRHPGFGNATVNDRVVELFDRNNVYVASIELPEIATRFVHEFDMGASPGPIQFELDVSDELLWRCAKPRVFPFA